MSRSARPAGNLWLAEELWKLKAIEFGDFTLGRTAVHSPIYINLRRLISSPKALAKCAKIIREELETLVSMLPPALDPPVSTQGETRLAIVGRPNVGKSSLVNRLAGEDLPALVVDPAEGVEALEVGGGDERPGRFAHEMFVGR